MPTASRVWGGSLHQTLRLLPAHNVRLEIFLDSDGLTAGEVLARLPYAAERAQSGGTGTPDARRYRDYRHVYQSAGLLFEDDLVRVTDLGHATRRWLGKLTLGNCPVLGRHAAYALAACQLRNPTRQGRSYASDLQVFPFAFIWRAMLALNDQIDSDELNRAIFRVVDEESLESAIETIAAHRSDPDNPDILGPETITERAKNDRVISWIALASFGWLLIEDKRETGGRWYRIRPRTRDVLREAAQTRRKHREFDSSAAYVCHISDAACLPRDVR